MIKFTKEIMRKMRMVNYFRGNYYIIPRIFENYFRIFVLRQKVLRYVEIALDYTCNANCYFCSCAKDRFQADPSKKILSLNDFENIVKDCKKSGHVLMIGIAGGEPLLSPILEDSIKIIRKNKILPLVVSNGILGTRDRLIKLKKAGLCWWCVSIHGIGKTHDKIVGVNGAYDKAINSLLIAREIGLIPQICITPTHETLANGEINKIVDFATKQKIDITVDYPVPSGRSQEDIKIMLTQEELKSMRNLCETNNFVSVDLQSNYSGYHCPAGDVCCYITSYGEVTPCPFIQISYGNVRKDSFGNIYKRMCSSKWFGEKHNLCLGGESKEFVTKFLMPIGDKPPLNVFEHPRKKEGLLK